MYLEEQAEAPKQVKSSAYDVRFFGGVRGVVFPVGFDSS